MGTFVFVDCVVLVNYCYWEEWTLNLKSQMYV